MTMIKLKKRIIMILVIIAGITFCIIYFSSHANRKVAVQLQKKSKPQTYWNGEEMDSKLIDNRPMEIKSKIHESGDTYLFQIRSTTINCAFANDCHELHIINTKTNESLQIIDLGSSTISALADGPILEVIDLNNDGYRDIRRSKNQVWIYNKELRIYQSEE